MVRLRVLLLAIGLSWKRWRHFARKDTNVSRSNPQIVRAHIRSQFFMAELSFSFLAAQALRLFTAITSADGYSKLTEHLGPDKKV